ncbi:MAG: ABC transporter ATP-binding protein, partial [Hyphomicrobiaceae bacterium]
VLLGPSGGGKTTLLRTIGGFNRPTEGRVLLHGNDVSDLPPDKRPTSMVFQSYALFPHMTVAGNVGYGLKLQKMPKAQIEEKIEAMLEMVGLQGYGTRKPHELSGGQQQRVQLARSLALDRDILLLDEPLAALDAKLRKDMCLELKHLQEKVGITFIHVTHNQEEAMTVADRIALIADGLLVENGSPDEIYEAPRKRFTADFVGENNILDCVVKKSDGNTATLEIGTNSITVPTGGSEVQTGQSVSISIRSELLQLARPGSERSNGYEILPATYREKVYLGLTTSHIVAHSSGIELNVRTMSGLQDDDAEFSEGQAVTVLWQKNAARLHVD